MAPWGRERTEEGVSQSPLHQRPVSPQGRRAGASLLLSKVDLTKVGGKNSGGVVSGEQQRSGHSLCRRLIF